MTTAADVIAIEDGWVAEPIVEQPVGSNHTRLGIEYGMDRVAWCAIALALAMRHAFSRWIGRSAAVSGWIADARNGVEGMVLLPPDAHLEPGDITAFDFGPAYGHSKGNPEYFHISTCRNPGTQSSFQTDGGNEGDRMRQQWRDRKYLQAIIRPPYSSSSLPPPPPVVLPREDDMPTHTLISNPATVETLAFKLNPLSGLIFVKNINEDPHGHWDHLAGLPDGLHPIDEPDADFQADGSLQVTVFASDGQLWAISRTAKDGWSQWWPIGKPY